MSDPDDLDSRITHDGKCQKHMTARNIMITDNI